MIIRILKLLHLFGLWKRLCLFFINYIFVGTFPGYKSIKIALCRAIGINVGSGTMIVGPIYVTGKLTIGRNCWINSHFCVHGNGSVIIGDNCDIAPEVSFLTGGHEIGRKIRRAGRGVAYTIRINDGTWIGARSTLLGNIIVGEKVVVAACSCVTKSINDNFLVAGVPAKAKRTIND